MHVCVIPPAIGLHYLHTLRYKKLKQYDEMVRLVKKFHPDLVDQTHAHLAKVSAHIIYIYIYCMYMGMNRPCIVG